MTSAVKKTYFWGHLSLINIAIGYGIYVGLFFISFSSRKDLIPSINSLASSHDNSPMKKHLLIPSTMAFLALSTAFGLATNPCYASTKNHTLIEQSLVIKASPKTVFEGIQQSRSEDPTRRHVVSRNQDGAVIDEKLNNLPVIGSAHLVYREIEVPFKRIDYELVSSDKLKAFEGSWELTPLDNGRETKVSLKSYTEVKIWVPFAKEMSGAQTAKDITRRLGNLKHWCDEQDIKEARVHNDESGRFAHSRAHSQLAQSSGKKSLETDCVQIEKDSIGEREEQH